MYFIIINYNADFGFFYGMSGPMRYYHLFSPENKLNKTEIL